MVNLRRLLGASVTGYFWLHRKPSKRQREREKALKLVTAAHEATRESYRLHQHLSNQGHSLSLHYVRRLREKNGIRCKRHKRFKNTTNSDHQKPVYDNHLKQQFEMERLNTAWSCDITYVLTDEGWLSPWGLPSGRTGWG